MRRTTLAIAIGIAASATYGGTAPYKPDGPQPADPTVGHFSYFCQSYATDGRYFVTKPQPAFQGKNDGTQQTKYTAAWTDYLSKTYGAKNISGPQCDVMADDRVNATYQNFVDHAAQMHRKTVDVDWHAP